MRGSSVTAPAGAVVRIYVDLAQRVVPGDVIQTQSGRRYGVLNLRVQMRGKHAGRQHLECVVLDVGESIGFDGPWRRLVGGEGDKLGTLHTIRWYKRQAKRRR